MKGYAKVKITQSDYNKMKEIIDVAKTQRINFKELIKEYTYTKRLLGLFPYEHFDIGKFSKDHPLIHVYEWDGIHHGYSEVIYDIKNIIDMYKSSDDDTLYLDDDGCCIIDFVRSYGND